MTSDRITIKKTIDRLDDIFVGRKAEFLALKTEFRKVVTGGMGLVLLSGLPGSGKTNLVSRFAQSHHPLTFVSIKLPNTQLQTVPSIFSLADQLSTHLMTLEKNVLNEALAQLSHVLKNDVSILAAISDNLSKLLNIKKKNINLDFIRLKYRIKNAIFALIDITAQYLGPLFIHIDDLQWSDSLSLDIIRKILVRKQPFNILLVLCFREQINPRNLQAIQSVVPSRCQHTLMPLTKTETDQYIRLALNGTIQNITAMTTLVFGWTGGNPFYIKQLLKIILAEGFIQYQQKKWKLHTDKVSNFFVGKDIRNKIMETLSAQSQDDILDIIACLGGKIPVPVLRTLIKDANLQHRLKKLISQGILIETESYLGSDVVFSHDLILSHVLSQMHKADRQNLHYQIALTLYHADTPDILNKNDLIAMQLMQTKDTLVFKNANQWVDILYEYGIKEKQSASLETALLIFERCCLALDHTSDSALSFYIRLEYAECLCLTGHGEEGFAIIQDIQKSHQDIDSRLALKRKLLYIYHNQRDYQKVLKTGQSILRLLGLGGGKLRMLYDLLVCRAHFDIRRIAQLEGFSNLSNPRISILLDTLTVMNTGAAVYDESKTAAIALSAALVSTKTHVASEMLIGCVSYAYVLKTLWNDQDKAERLTQKVLTLCDVTLDAENKSMVYFIIGSFLSHWSFSLKAADEFLQKSIEFGYVSADFLFLSYAISASLDIKAFMGVTPNALLTYITLIKDRYGDVLQYQAEFNLSIYARHIQILQTGQESGVSNEVQPVSRTMTPFERLTEDMLLLERLFLLDDIFSGYNHIKTIARSVHGARGLVSEVYLDFYSLLIKAGMHDHLNPIQQFLNQISVKRTLKKIKQNALMNPSDFSAFYKIAYAEYQNISGNRITREYFDAIQSAASTKNEKLSVISNLLAARRHPYQPDVCQSYAEKAADYCRSWGAAYIADQIESQFQLAENHKKNRDEDASVINDIGVTITRYSLMAIGKSQDETIRLFLSAVIDKQVFDSCAVILQKGSQLFVVSHATKYKPIIKSNAQIEINRAPIPKKMVRYAARSESQVVYCPGDSSPFSDDPYIRSNPDLNLACIPMFNCRVFIGIIYLEKKYKIESNDMVWVNCLIPSLVSALEKIRDINIKKMFMPAPKNKLLSRREMDIIKLLAYGLSNEDIAGELHLSIATVKKHISSILFKLNVSNRTQAVLKGKEIRLI